ncbi:ATP-binding protein [Corynebacterium glutamicum]|uniref:ATP-binding protein n=1 Tax=Corynebacterium glutamicum TaxID=1718 RepID=UPI0009427617|nr:ATP-binding protein [Corynebacterium glutamicum]OKX84270.1 hypothetical protein AUO95_03540 [Corynebacterium glutamicum]
MTDITDLAKVISVGPSLIEIEISSTDDYEMLQEKPQIGSYIQISDGDGSPSKLIAVVQGFRVKDSLGNEHGGTETKPRFILSLQPVGHLEDGKFKRGGQQITIPPKLVEIASSGLLEMIYSSVPDEKKFSFGKLAQDKRVTVELDGDRFFSKHIGVVGSTGSGKSSTVAAILQEGIRPTQNQSNAGKLNNSHIIIFDLHGEYSSAFPKARVLGVEDLRLPYWMMNSEELEEMFIESKEQNSHNQVSQFRNAVIMNKQISNQEIPKHKISYDSPLYFSLEEVCTYLHNLNNEVIGKEPSEGVPKLADETLVTDRAEHYFKTRQSFFETSTAKGKKASNGPFVGEFHRFLMRLEARQNDQRLDFLLKPRKPDAEEYKSDDVQEILEQFLGYGDEKTNVTILDLSGIPFEVLSVVVSLVTRMVFTFSFHFKKLHVNDGAEVPFLLVLEEAHNYISRAEGAKFNSVRKAVERVAKEGRKYGISLMIVSQRPSEISETVFSQCGNFVAMRLTNPTDQNYVRRLLPDDVGAITGSLATLEQREALVLGDAIALPSLISVDEITNLPTSSDVAFHSEWQKDWYAEAIEGVIEKWRG